MSNVGNRTLTPDQLALVKQRLGLKSCSCEHCQDLGSDGDGPEYNGSWPMCNFIDRYTFLKSFPFKKDMKCFVANFWFTKFAEEIDGDVFSADAEREKELHRRWIKAVEDLDEELEAMEAKAREEVKK